MPLQLSSFSGPVRTLLADLAPRPFPLVHMPPAASAVPDVLERTSAADLFPSARYPQEALSGLFLRLNRWEKSHQLSQDLNTPEGSYWHGIAHRLEPDYGNAAYWFRRVGRHPIFDPLHSRTIEIIAEHRTPWWLKDSWDPLLFVRWCEEAAGGGDPAKQNAAMAVQTAEWELLFEWCGAGI